MPVQFDREKKIFLCSTDKMSYAFGLTEDGIPVNLHWGGKKKSAIFPQPTPSPGSASRSTTSAQNSEDTSIPQQTVSTATNPISNFSNRIRR